MLLEPGHYFCHTVLRAQTGIKPMNNVNVVDNNFERLKGEK